MTTYAPATSRPGPSTPAGKAVAARNATSHGLFSRDVVLPHLGEDATAYNELYLEFCDQLGPQNLLECHYVEKICAASWRLRRLHRWQAQIYEDARLTEDERLDKLDKVLRHETTLHRQIDQAVRLLNRDVPQIFARRARAAALAELDATEADCKIEPELAADVERAARDVTHRAALAPDFDRRLLDNTYAPSAPASADPTPPGLGAGRPTNTQFCENEPPPPTGIDERARDRARDVDFVHPDGRPVYLQPDLWRALQRMRDYGEHERAAEFDAHYRSLHLLYQTGHHQAPESGQGNADVNTDTPTSPP